MLSTIPSSRRYLPTMGKGPTVGKDLTVGKGSHVPKSISPKFLPAIPLAGLMLLLAVVTGCSGDSVERASVSGQVLVDGKPVSSGFIRVYPDGLRAATSQLDKEGRFNLTSHEVGDGLPLGTHVVTVDGSELLSRTERRWHAPMKYSRVSSSGLSLDVTGPTEECVINLTWNGREPFTERLKLNLGD